MFVFRVIGKQIRSTSLLVALRAVAARHVNRAAPPIHPSLQRQGIHGAPVHLKRTIMAVVAVATVFTPIVHHPPTRHSRYQIARPPAPPTH